MRCGAFCPPAATMAGTGRVAFTTHADVVQVRPDSAGAWALVRLARALLYVLDSMNTKRWLAVLIALVVVPTSLLWGAFLLIPAALLLLPFVLLAALAAVPAMLVAATSTRNDAAHPQAPVPTAPVYST
jgi:hypothetical protein